MTAQISVYGRLVDDPQTKQTSKGTPMTLARMAVSLPCSQSDDGLATLWLSVGVWQTSRRAGKASQRRTPERGG